MNVLRMYQIINRFREKAPVDLEGLASALGIDVALAYLDPDISGQIECKNDRYKITLNAEDAPLRRRFTLAHELGHFVFHRHLIGDGLDDNRAYRSTNVGLYHNTDIGPSHETEANRFAANLLMPPELISAYKGQGLGYQEMAEKFEVSDAAMKIRLGI